MQLSLKLYYQLIITVHYMLMSIYFFVSKCVCVRREAAARTARGPLHRWGKASCGSCRFSSSPPPAPTRGPHNHQQQHHHQHALREHTQFTLCLLTLVTFTADELFVVLPQPTRLKKKPLCCTGIAAAWSSRCKHWQCGGSGVTAAHPSRCRLHRGWLFFC